MIVDAWLGQTVVTGCELSSFKLEFYKTFLFSHNSSCNSSFFYLVWRSCLKKKNPTVYELVTSLDHLDDFSYVTSYFAFKSEV